MKCKSYRQWDCGVEHLLNILHINELEFYVHL